MFLVFAFGSSAEQTNVLEWWTSWKYFDEGFEPAGDWTVGNYDDSGWDEGVGIFGLPQNEFLPTSDAQVLTPLITNAMGSYTITYYFRTRFTLAAPTTLTFSNAIDDGAIMYLDGAELIRFGMPTGAVDYATLASNQRASDISLRGYDVFTITNLAPGEHVLAAEVHQFSTNSSDVIFGVKAVADLPDLAPSITREPQDETVRPGIRPVFSAEVSGTAPIGYQWYVNNSPINGARSLAYQTPTVSSAMNGWLYHLVASNSSGVVTSRQARLTVLDNAFGPRLIRAAEDPRSNRRVIVNFDRSLNIESATNSANYQLHEIGGHRAITVTNVNFGPTFVRLWLADVMDGAEWMLMATDIEDEQRTAVTVSSQVPVIRRIRISLAMDDFWRWHAGNPGPGWQERHFNDSTWPTGQGIFYSDLSPLMPCFGATNTLLSAADRVIYFRKTFSVDEVSNPTTMAFDLTNFVDDGAVFYLNGIEIHRVNMPLMPISDASPAYMNVEPTRCLSAIGSSTHVLAGTNVLAAEVHQSSFDSEADIAFGVAFAATILGQPAVPMLAISREGDKATVVSSAEGYRLESAPAVTGPWTPVEMANSRYETEIITSARFFRLVNP